MTLPIREAIVVSGPDDSSRRVGGVPLILRTILTLQRAGIERCTLVGAEAPVDPRLRCPLTLAPTLRPAADDALRLIVDSGTVIDEELVRELQASAVRGKVVELAADGARVRVAPGPLVAANGGTGHRPQRGFLRPAAAAAGLLERDLVRRLENPRDGYLDRLLHRRLSRPLTCLVLGRGLGSPNAVTLIGIALGVVGGLLLGAPGLLPLSAAVLLLEASAVLDCTDGELARLQLAESRFGHWLDVTGDVLVHLALLAGIAIRITAERAGPGGSTLVALGLGVMAAFVIVSWCEESEARRRQVDGWQNRVLDRVLLPLTTRDWHLFVVAFALAGRLDLLVPAAAVAAHVFWVATLVLLLGVIRRA
jgi:phosphatidylglycerophosphate synthase